MEPILMGSLYGWKIFCCQTSIQEKLQRKKKQLKAVTDFCKARHVKKIRAVIDYKKNL